MNDPLSALMSAWKEGMSAGSLSAEADVVSYSIFHDSVPSADSGGDWSGAALAVLSELRMRIDALLQPLLSDFIWQNEPFALELVPANSADSPFSCPHLRGSTNFGDNVEDEWFIVYLL